MPFYAVSGETFQYKAEFDEYGFRWNKIHKAWWIDSRDVRRNQKLERWLSELEDAKVFEVNSWEEFEEVRDRGSADDDDIDEGMFV